jgi:hypothetical protein
LCVCFIVCVFYCVCVLIGFYWNLMGFDMRISDFNVF